MAVTAPVNPYSNQPYDSPDTGILESGETAYPYAWMTRISTGTSKTSEAGQFTPYTGTAGEFPCGRMIPSGSTPQYDSARANGSILGDGTEKISVDVSRRVIIGIPVTGIAALTDAGKLVYLADGDELTLTKGTGATIGGTAVGYVRKVISVSAKTCEVVEYSEAEIIQSLTEEGVL